MSFFIIEKFILFTLKADSFDTRNKIDKIELLILGETR
jgi:hypothetical protein